MPLPPDYREQESLWYCLTHKPAGYEASFTSMPSKNPDTQKDKPRNRDQEPRQRISSSLTTVLGIVIDIFFVWPKSHALAWWLGVLFVIIKLFQFPFSIRWTVVTIGGASVIGIVGQRFVPAMPPSESMVERYLIPASDLSPPNPCFAVSFETANERYQARMQHWIKAKATWKQNFHESNPFPAPTPPDRSQFPSSKAIYFFIGPVVGFFEPHDPLKKTILIVDGSPLLWLERTDKGLLLSTDIFGKDGNLILTINRNRLYPASPHQYGYLVHEPEDPSTLEIFDAHGDEILYIRFANPYTIVLRANFFSRAGTLVRILEHEIDVNSVAVLKVPGICSAHRPNGSFLKIIRDPQGFILDMN